MSYRSPNMGYRTKKWNDLEWELHLEQPVRSSRSRTGRWHCGDAKELKKLISNFSKNSSAHGTAYICDSSSGTSKFMKIVYKVLFVLCLLNVVGSIVFLLQENLGKESIYINSISKDTVAGMVEDPDYFPHYPRVTICRRPSYRTDLNISMLQLLEYANIALGFPFSGLTPKEISDLILVARHRVNPNLGRLSPEVVDFQETLDDLQNEYDKYKNSTTDFNLKNFVIDNSYKCSEIFIDCVALVLKMNCCEVFHPSLTPLGLCYEMILDSQILQTMANSKIHFTLSIDLKNPPHRVRPLEEGFLVGFSDPKDDPTGAMIQDVEMAIPHYLTYLKVKLIRTQRNALHTAWHGLSESCPSMPEFEGINSTYGEHYSLQTCDIYYLMSIFVKYCNCQALVFPGNTSKRFCDPADIYQCVLAAYAKDNLTEMHHICESPCIEYKFRSEASYIGLGGSNNSRVVILYDTEHYTYNEYRTATFNSLFSQIGGSLGLYLGASIITTVELLSFTVMWMWYRCVPTWKTKVQQSPSSQGKRTR